MAGFTSKEKHFMGDIYDIPAKAMPRNASPVLVVVHEDPNFVCKGMRCGKTYPQNRLILFLYTYTHAYIYI